MLTALRKFFFFLEKRHLRRLGFLFAIVITMSILEVAGIASILPFLHLAANPESVDQNPWLGWLYQTMGFNSHKTMLIVFGWAVVLFLTFSSALGAFSVWQRQRIAWNLAHELSMKLASNYSKLPYEFFLNHSSPDLIKKNIDDVNALVTGVLLAGSQFLCQIIISVMMFVLLLIVQPWIAISAFGLIALIYILIFICRRKYLTNLGRERLRMNLQRYQTFVELVSGIKTIKTDGSAAYFESRFEEPSKRFSEIHPQVQFAAAVPRYAVEAIGFGGVVLVTLYLVSSGNSFAESLPMLTLFALAGYRLIPNINGAYSSIVQVLSNYPAIDSIYDDLLEMERNKPEPERSVKFSNSIALKNISFHYEGGVNVVDDVTLSIAKGERVAFVGPSGSGKTTLVNVVMGLLSHQQGEFYVDGTRIEPATTKNWQALIGFVPQEVFLYDDTIANNIAFGKLPIDQQRLKKACDSAQISSFIENDLDAEYETLIGERGARLSGGQRQRLGLARALYRQPQVLILDEATSSLDNVTEKSVVDAIHHQLPGVTIVMIAHRISTVRACDRLYVMDRGKLVAQGSYDELLDSNDLFRDLANFS